MPLALDHKPADMSIGNQQQLHDDVILADDAVRLVKSLLELHPLSQRTSAEAPPLLVSTPSLTSDQATTVGSTQQQFAAAALPQVQANFSQRWPTPKPSEWQDIQLVFARACVTLTWALSIPQRDI